MKNIYNSIKPTICDFSIITALYIDEINIQARHLFRSKTSLFSLFYDELEYLAKSILILMLSTLTSKKTSINLICKLVHNLKHNF